MSYTLSKLDFDSMEGDNNKLTLLAGVAIDKSHEALCTTQGKHEENNILYMDNNVEVQYIIDSSGQLHVSSTSATDEGESGGTCRGDGSAETLRLHVQVDDQLQYSIATDEVTSIVVKKCLICCTLCDPNNVRDIVNEAGLAAIILRYIPHLLISKDDLTKPGQSVCVDCINRIYGWHEFNVRVAEMQNIKPICTESEGDDEQSQTPTETSEPSTTRRSKHGRVKTNSEIRAQLISATQAQCKSLLLSSPYNFLMKREMTSEDWETIADKLISTKSSTSPKIKEIESMSLSAEKVVSIFCVTCYKSIPGGYAGFQSHVLEVHRGEDLKIPCDICGGYFPLKDTSARSQDYFPHWIAHFFFDKCTHEGCSEVFPNKFTLNRHMELHQSRPGFPCSVCGKVLGKQSTLEVHLKTHLPEEEKKKQAKSCPICNKVIYAPSLKAHMFSVHSEERPWTCDICPSTFKHKSDLNCHRKTVHEKLRHFVCPICDQRFGHQCGLRVHLLKHENNRQFSCPVCSKKFITRWHLRNHQTTHKTVKDIICEICNKGFKKEESLREHMTLHTGEKPFSCHICGRKVRVLSNLYKHFQVHKKNKTWKSKEDMDALAESTGKVVVTNSNEIIIPNSHNLQVFAGTQNGSRPTILAYEIVNNPTSITNVPSTGTTEAGPPLSIQQVATITNISHSEAGNESTVWIAS